MIVAVWAGLLSLAGYRTDDSAVSANIPALVAMHELVRNEMRSGLTIGGSCEDETPLVAKQSSCEIPTPSEPQFLYSDATPMTYDFRRMLADASAAAGRPATPLPAELPFDPLEELQAAEAAVFTDTQAGAMPIEPSNATATDGDTVNAVVDVAAQADSNAETVVPREDNPASLGQSFRHFLDESGGSGGEVRDITHHIKSGESISQVLVNAGIEHDEIREWVQAAQQIYNLNRVYAGQEISLRVDTQDNALQRLSFETGRTSVLIAQRDENGISAELREIPHYQRLRVVGAEITSSLYMAAIEKGIPDTVISDIAEILGWEINFAKDLHAGATFRVVFEELVRSDTDESMPGRVLAVDVTNRGRSHEGFYFITPDGGRGGYYNRNGEALGRAFLRYPVKYSRISSHFSDARYHPILKTKVPHYGVDFAAASGTPVQAVADGAVLMARWHRGNGRFVKLRHDSTYESGYAHLSRIAPGLKPGMRVRKGEVIGYVGMTGLATGPHLHFAMYRNGAYIDPLATELPRDRSLSGSTLAAYEMALGMIDHAYTQAGYSPDVVAQLSSTSAID
jgi:murein DD-endopeptidase MepM/ murein hydrolase activator NlpD